MELVLHSFKMTELNWGRDYSAVQANAEVSFNEDWARLSHMHTGR